MQKYNFNCNFVWVRYVALREEHRLRMLENRLLRKIFGPKRDGMVEGWRRLYSEGLHSLYCSPSMIRMTKSRRTRWASQVERMGRRTDTGFW
jgi:hypothetical protein